MNYNTYLENEYWKSKVTTDALYMLCKSKGIDVDGDTPAPTPEPEPIPTPTPHPEPTPAPTTGDPEIVYNGKSAYTIGVGESMVVTFYGMNSTNFNDFTVEMTNAFGTMPVIKYKLKQTHINNGCRFDYTITGNTKGTATVTMSPNSNRNQKVKVVINVR